MERAGLAQRIVGVVEVVVQRGRMVWQIHQAIHGAAHQLLLDGRLVVRIARQRLAPGQDVLVQLAHHQEAAVHPQGACLRVVQQAVAVAKQQIAQRYFVLVGVVGRAAAGARPGLADAVGVAEVALGQVGAAGRQALHRFDSKHPHACAAPAAGVRGLQRGDRLFQPLDFCVQALPGLGTDRITPVVGGLVLQPDLQHGMHVRQLHPLWPAVVGQPVARQGPSAGVVVVPVAQHAAACGHAIAEGGRQLVGLAVAQPAALQARWREGQVVENARVTGAALALRALGCARRRHRAQQGVEQGLGRRPVGQFQQHQRAVGDARVGRQDAALHLVRHIVVHRIGQGLPRLAAAVGEEPAPGCLLGGRPCGRGHVAHPGLGQILQQQPGRPPQHAAVGVAGLWREQVGQPEQCHQGRHGLGDGLLRAGRLRGWRDVGLDRCACLLAQHMHVADGEQAAFVEVLGGGLG